jgi:hypothetical protein
MLAIDYRFHGFDPNIMTSTEKPALLQEIQKEIYEKIFQILNSSSANN